MEQVEVRRPDLDETRIITVADAPLAPGSVRLRVESFAVTANNVTYAVIGDGFGYWNFFPASEGWGIVPMWGHAMVEASAHPAIVAGERVYGYLPMATHLVVMPDRVSSGGFADASPHRQPMAAIYNQYSRLDADPEHDPAQEESRMVFGPLFKTGFLIEAAMRRNGWHGAQQVVLTSASSKTAMALAHCIRASSPDMTTIGLTSLGNADFVRATGLYDRVLPYGEEVAIPDGSSVTIDFAGNAQLLRTLHRLLDGRHGYSCLVGATHVDGRAGGGEALQGPVPTLFFAPTEAAETVKALGPDGFARAVAASWKGFLDRMAGVIEMDRREGLAAAAAAFAETLAGRADPARGIIIRP